MDVERIQDRFAPVLGPLGAAWSALMGVRRRLYENGALRRWRADVPCVCVGNIGWGGTGKTPLTDWLLGWAEGRGIRPAVLTRGYGARPPSRPHVVDPGDDPAHCGDEPLLLGRGHPLARVVVDHKRARSGPFAQERFSPDMFILDDGFQHLAAGRDMDLVLLSPEDLSMGWNRVFPAGTWREGEDALSRADCFLVKVRPAEAMGLRPFVESRLGRFEKPVFTFYLEYDGYVLADGTMRSQEAPFGEYFLVTGVGDPSQVVRSATDNVGRAPRGHEIFRDHHPYAPTDVKRILERAGGAAVLTTPKDAVKLARAGGGGFWTMNPVVRFGPAFFSDQEFTSFWENLYQDACLKKAK